MAKPRKGTSKDRHQRIQHRMSKRIDQSSGGKLGVCSKCGRSFEQIWRPEKKLYTKFKTCPDCRMAAARGFTTAKIPYKPHVNQIPIHESDVQFKLLCAGARFGKDRCMVNEYIKKFTEMLSEKRGPEMIPAVHGWVVAPTFKLASQVWRELLAFFPSNWIVHQWESDKMIETLNDGIIEVRSADDPEGLVGVGLDIVLVTEAARIKHFDQVWANLEMRLLSDGRGPNGNGGLALINGTPRGKGYYYEMFRWGQKTCPEYEPEWESWQYSSWDNPYLTNKDEKYLKSIKRRFPKRIYDQEVLGLFLADGNSVFPTAEQCATYTGDAQPEPGEVYTIGYDPGQSVDYPAIVIRNSKGQAVKAGRIPGGTKSWTAQIDMVEYYSRKYNYATVIIDKNGPGATIPEQLESRGVNVISSRFSNAEKIEMANNLAILIEQKMISYPNDAVLINELLDYTYKYTKSGRYLTFSASTSKRHDDVVSAMMLAFSDYQTIVDILPFVGAVAGINNNSKKKHRKQKMKMNEKLRDTILSQNNVQKQNKSEDIMFDICVNQGYVPPTCQMPGQMIFKLMQTEDPCAGCNCDRKVCHGRPKKKNKKKKAV